MTCRRPDKKDHYEIKSVRSNILSAYKIFLQYKIFDKILSNNLYVRQIPGTLYDGTLKITWYCVIK